MAKSRNSHLQQKLADLLCAIEPDDQLDYTRLPVKPDGFVIKQVDREKYVGKMRDVCLLRMVSMAIMYYWLFVKIADDQDFVSCDQYCKWLVNYTPMYQVYGEISKGWYLANPDHCVKRKGKVVGPPPVPKWIREGTTT